MRIGVVGNPRYKDLPELLARLADHVSRNRLTLASEAELAGFWPEPVPELSENLAGLQLLITIGGDGTLLRGARLLGPSTVPILGVNMGRVGFLTTTSPENLEDALSVVVEGKHELEELSTLQASIIGGGGEERGGALALNDIVVHKAGVAHVVRFRVAVDGAEVGQYSSDGIIVASPTGSTGYSLSAGGPIVMPAVDALVVTAICPHAFSFRPLVVPGSAVITLQVAPPWRDEVIASYDGQHGSTLSPDDRVIVGRSPSAVHLVRLGKKGYLDRVRELLQWSDLRAREG